MTDHEYLDHRACPHKHLFRLHKSEALGEDSLSAWNRNEATRLRTLVSHLFPNAIDLRGSARADRVAATARLLADGATVANARFASAGDACRIDFAFAQKDTLRIYHVVPKIATRAGCQSGLEFITGAGAVRAAWQQHIAAMAFRVAIAERQFGTTFARVVPFFIVPVKNAAAKIEGLHAISTGESDPTRRNPLANEASRLLCVVSIDQACRLFQPADRHNVSRGFAAGPPRRGYHCKKCEAFRPCWGPLADVKPHIFELNRVWFVNDPQSPKERIVHRLVREGRVALSEIPIEAIRGPFAARQRMQIEGERRGCEIIGAELAGELEKITYPLCGLDIETVRSLVPVHAEAKVNGLTIFLYNLTVQNEPGGLLRRFDWLNTERANPNRRFLESLRSVLPERGTVLIYSDYEEVSLRLLLEEMIANDDVDEARWLQQFLTSGRLFDLHQIAQHWWAPGLAGKTSLKALLRVMWSMDDAIKHREPFCEFPPEADPYSFLKSIGGVADGCAAMRAYSALQAAEGEPRERIAADLRRYVATDAWANNYLLEFLRSRCASAAPTKKHEPQ